MFYCNAELYINFMWGGSPEAVSKLGKQMDMRSEGPTVNRPGRQAGINLAY
jgi:hypothetical protein